MFRYNYYIIVVTFDDIQCDKYNKYKIALLLTLEIISG